MESTEQSHKGKGSRIEICGSKLWGQRGEKRLIKLAFLTISRNLWLISGSNDTKAAAIFSRLINCSHFIFVSRFGKSFDLMKI